MAFIRLAFLLWRQRLWYSIQLSLLQGAIIVGSLAGVVWVEHQHNELDHAKQHITLTLILAPTTTSDHVATLIHDLKALAPTLVHRIEQLSDTAVAEHLQHRYGVALSDFMGDSLFPRLLRVYFNPMHLTQSSFTAFVEQCHTIEEITAVHYPLSRVSTLFEREHHLQWLGGALLAGWVIVITVGLFLHLRATVPLSRRDTKTLVLMGASSAAVRRSRVYYVTFSAIVGIIIATVVTSVAWALHLSLLDKPHTLAIAGGIASAATLIIGLLLSALVTPGYDTHT